MNIYILIWQKDTSFLWVDGIPSKQYRLFHKVAYTCTISLTNKSDLSVCSASANSTSTCNITLLQSLFDYSLVAIITGLNSRFTGLSNMLRVIWFSVAYSEDCKHDTRFEGPVCKAEEVTKYTLHPTLYCRRGFFCYICIYSKPREGPAYRKYGVISGLSSSKEDDPQVYKARYVQIYYLCK